MENKIPTLVKTKLYTPWDVINAYHAVVNEGYEARQAMLVFKKKPNNKYRTPPKAPTMRNVARISFYRESSLRPDGSSADNHDKPYVINSVFNNLVLEISPLSAGPALLAPLNTRTPLDKNVFINPPSLSDLANKKQTGNIQLPRPPQAGFNRAIASIKLKVFDFDANQIYIGGKEVKTVSYLLARAINASLLMCLYEDVLHGKEEYFAWRSFSKGNLLGVLDFPDESKARYPELEFARDMVCLVNQKYLMQITGYAKLVERCGSDKKQMPADVLESFRECEHHCSVNFSELANEVKACVKEIAELIRQIENTETKESNMENKQNPTMPVGGFKKGEMAVVMASIKDEITPDAVTLNGITYYREGVDIAKTKTALLVRPMEHVNPEEEPAQQFNELDDYEIARRERREAQYASHRQERDRSFQERSREFQERSREFQRGASRFQERLQERATERVLGSRAFGRFLENSPERIGCSCCNHSPFENSFSDNMTVKETPFYPQNPNDAESLSNTTGVVGVVIQLERALEDFKQLIAGHQTLYSAKHLVPEEKPKPNQAQHEVLSEWAEYMVKIDNKGMF